MKKLLLSFLKNAYFFLFFKYLGIIIGIVLFNWPAIAQENIELFSHLPYEQQLSNIWGYAQNGREYALVGLYDGTSIVDVTDKNNLQPLFHVEGVPSIWREIKTWQHYAYMVSESGGGLQIIDLQYLPDSIQTYEWHGGFWQQDTLEVVKAHTNFVDENGILYLNGTNLDAVVMCDVLTNPTNPTIVGLYEDGYVHDLFVRNDTMWTGEIYNGYFGVVNVSDKANPVLMATQNTPNAFTHNTWLTNDGHYLFTTDEKTGAFVTCYDVSDISDIKETDRYQSSPGSGVIPHNTYVVHKNDQTFVVTSYYRDGVTIIDANNPYNLVETGYYDTSPLSGVGFNGAWGVYPYLPSGALLVSDMEEGLFVLNPNYTQAAYLQGMVTSDLGMPLSGVLVSIEGYTAHNTLTTFDGNFSTGIPQNGTYNVTFYLYGYLPQTVPVTFQNGQTTVQNITLQAIVPFVLSINVLDENGEPLPNADVGVFNTTYNVEHYAVSDNNGMAYFTLFYTDTYEILTGKWGYNTTQRFVNGSELTDLQTISLNRGYYDDFTFQNNWQVSGNSSGGQWDRGTPHSISFLGNVVNPDGDILNDFGKKCYITGTNAAISSNVNDGTTILTSPIFDLSSYQNPILSYYRWIYFQDESNGIVGNDTLYVWLDNGITSVLLEQVYNGNIYESQWRNRSYLVSNHLEPTSQMRLILRISDKPISPHIVKGGLDLFRVTEGTLPQPQIGVTDNYICAGESVQFMNLTEGDMQQITWILSGSNTPLSSATNPIVTYNTPGDYNVSLIVTNFLGSNTLQETAYIHVGQPPANLQISDFNNQICLGTAAQVSAFCDDPNATFTWQGNGIDGAIEGSNIAIIPTQVGTQPYILTANNAYCGTSLNFPLQVQAPPTSTIVGNTHYCTNDTLDLNVQGNGSETIYTWQNILGEIIGTTPNFTINNLPTNDTTLTLIATLSDELGCASSDTVVIQLTTPPSPNNLTFTIGNQYFTIDEFPTTVCLLSLSINPTISVANTSGTISGYSWAGPYIVGDTQSESITLDLDNLQDTNLAYTLGLTNNENCETTINIAFTVDICDNIHSPTGSNTIDITAYPNPTSDYLTISAKGLGNGLATYKIFNSLGQLLMNPTSNNGLYLSEQNSNITLNLEKLAAGVYWLQILGQEHTGWVRVVRL